MFSGRLAVGLFFPPRGVSSAARPPRASGEVAEIVGALVLSIQEPEVAKAIAKRSVTEQLAERTAQSDVAKASQLQYIDKLVDVLVAPRPTVEKTTEAPHVQYIDKVDNFS